DLNIDLEENGGIFEGANGAGKTNFLEAIYFLCTGRSQRGAKKSEIINFDSDYFYSSGVFVDDENTEITTSIGFGKNKSLVLKLNDVKIKKFTEWFGYRPIISFGVDDIQIIRGAPENRRKFIDILCSQIDKEYLAALISYKYWLHCRNLLLSQMRNIDEIQCEIYEKKMAETGSVIFEKRNEIVQLVEKQRILHSIMIHQLILKYLVKRTGKIYFIIYSQSVEKKILRWVFLQWVLTEMI
ncbi:MAG: AAA family ATPase, partial [Fibrobacter sp.]|nr:AAA family ATPase [Fibrobacter sp.]